ncbi:MAG: NAD(P)-dependent oxidoreductase [Burkholderiaceae bacterium]|jgi:D-3-phosphoglycerate dehydrogenase
MKPLVLLTDAIHPQVHAHLEQFATVRVAPDTRPDTLIQAAREAQVIVVRSPLPPALFDTADALRGVIRHGAGVDMIPIDAASARAVAVANAPGANAQSVAEYAVGQMISLAHRLTQIDKALRASSWPEARALSVHAREITGRTVGLVGTGAIGQAVGRICHFGFGMKVLGYSPSGRTLPDYIQPATLDALFAGSDFVVLACPLNDQTRGLVNSALLHLMKTDAGLINVARGAVIQHADLIQALADGRIAGAALDVFPEQPLDPESALFTFPNVILSPHLAGITDESLQRMGDVVAGQVIQLLHGELPTHLVNTAVREPVRRRLAALQAADLS